MNNHNSCGYGYSGTKYPTQKSTTKTEDAATQQAVNLPPSGQAGSSPANGTKPSLEQAMELVADAARKTYPLQVLEFRTDGGRALVRWEPDSHNVKWPKEVADESRFDERVACAAIVLQQSAASGQPQMDWAQATAKAILARDAK